MLVRSYISFQLIEWICGPICELCLGPVLPSRGWGSEVTASSDYMVPPPRPLPRPQDPGGRAVKDSRAFTFPWSMTAIQVSRGESLGWMQSSLRKINCDS